MQQTTFVRSRARGRGLRPIVVAKGIDRPPGRAVPSPTRPSTRSRRLSQAGRSSTSRPFPQAAAPAMPASASAFPMARLRPASRRWWRMCRRRSATPRGRSAFSSCCSTATPWPCADRPARLRPAAARHPGPARQRHPEARERLPARWPQGRDAFEPGEPRAAAPQGRGQCCNPPRRDGPGGRLQASGCGAFQPGILIKATFIGTMRRNDAARRLRAGRRLPAGDPCRCCGRPAPRALRDRRGRCRRGLRGRGGGCAGRVQGRSPRAAAVGRGPVRRSFEGLVRGLVGDHGFCRSATRGTGSRPGDSRPAARRRACAGRPNGALASTATGAAVGQAQTGLGKRGTRMVEPGEQVDAGPVIGAHAYRRDLEVDPCVRSSSPASARRARAGGFGRRPCAGSRPRRPSPGSPGTSRPG